MLFVEERWLAMLGGKNRLRLLRKERNLTQTQLGEMVGRDKGTISKYESGEIETRMVMPLAEALGLANPLELFFRPEQIAQNDEEIDWLEFGRSLSREQVKALRNLIDPQKD